MARIVLIDDERIVLNGIAAVIRRDPEYDLVGTADNGVDGLALVLKERPDIVMTDIRMPGKTGLEVIRESKDLLPDTAYIVFSGYNEFRYVKEAIGLGVIDYLEKPVTMPKLKEVLAKAVGLLRYKENYTAMARDLKKADHAYVESCLRDLCEHPADEEEILRRMLGKAPALRTCRSLLALQISGKQTETIEGIRDIISRLTFDVLEKDAVEAYPFYGQDVLMLVYFNLSPEDFPFLERLSRQKKALQDEGLLLFAGVSRIHSDFYELSTALQEARRSHRYAAYLEAENLVRFDEVEYTSQVPEQFLGDHRSLEFSFRTGEYDQCREEIRSYLEYLGRLELIPDILVQKCLELVFQFQQLMRDAGLTLDAECAMDLTYLKSLTSGESIVNWTREYVDRLLDISEARLDRGTNRTIRLVKQYVEKHYSEGISLDEIASEVGMSSTYLSMLFKKEEGITYIRYLTKVRMEKAMELLGQGHKAKDVCEMVGYHDYKYFSSQFKTVTGMTLDSYKKSL